MSQSLVNIYVHIIFSTKNRIPILKPPFEKKLHAYIGGICREMNCIAVKVGGYIDHAHILCRLSKKTSIVELVKVIKTNSSKWIKTNEES